MKRVNFLVYLAPLLVNVGFASSVRGRCQNVDYDDDDLQFCPQPGDPLDATLCCGYPGARYCCSEWTEDVTDLGVGVKSGPPMESRLAEAFTYPDLNDARAEERSLVKGGIKLIGIVVGAVIFVVVVCVVCCCCCPFCLLYKRKQRGHVISRNPGVVAQGVGPGVGGQGQNMGHGYAAVSGQPGNHPTVQYPPQPAYQHQPVYPQQPHVPQQPVHYPPQPAYPQQPPPYPGPPLASVQKQEYQTQSPFNPNLG